MAEICIKIPDELSNEISKHSDIALAKIFERAVKEELEERTKRQLLLSALNKLLENSKLSDEDCLKLGREVNEGMYKRLKEEGLL